MEYMSPRKFLKNLSILCVFASILVGVGYGTFVYADKYVWTYLGSPTTNWQAVAMTNSLYGYAARDGYLYTTTNGGASWNPPYNFGSQYIIRSIAASENGSYVLVSFDDLAGEASFAVSNDYGTSFYTTAPYASDFQGVAMNESGQYMYVADYNYGRVLYSNDFGSSWNYANIGYNPTSVAVSNDGKYVYAANYNGYILRSEDFGASYSVSAGVGYGFYLDIAASADGRHVYAIPTSGYPLYSADYGHNFSSLTAPGSLTWKSVSVSGDGSRVVLVYESGSASQVYSSRDFGATFTTESAVGGSRWNDISLSSDGYTTLLASSDSYVWMGSWDFVLPAITNISSLTSNGTYRAGQNIQLYVTFSEPVYTSSLDLTLETGSTDRQCNTGGIGEGITAATCIYSIQPGDVTSDLSTIAINGSLIDDAANQRNDHSAALAFLASNQSIVIDAVAPAVSLTAPTNGSVASSTVSLTATASDVGTGLVGVQFRVGTTSIGVEDTSSPYTASWNSTAVADGSYTLHAVARDVAGNFATSSVTITVDNTAPAAPGTPDLLASADTGNSNSDNITASTTPQFTSSCVTGSTVRFFHGGSNLIGTATCSATSSATIVSSTLTSGTYSITARQSDAVGNTSSSSSALSVTIDASAPIISITSPVDGSYASGTISLVATSTDAVSSVYGVLFRHVNSGTQIGTEDTSSPYSVSWNTALALDGSNTVRATATDAAGNTASTTITLIIDNNAPATSMVLDLATLSDTGASTTDNLTSDTTPDISTNCENNATVRLYRAGSTLIGSGVCSSGTVTITSSTLADGSHTITARQTDLAGNTSSASAGLSITVDTTGPSVSFTTPANLDTASGTISLVATASDAGTGITGVQFKVGTTNIGSEDTTSPYGTSLDTTTLSDGVYTLNAVARDVVGNFSTSSVSITVDNTAPVAPGTPDLTTGTDTGDSSMDDSTSNATPQFTVSCVNGSTVRIFSAGSTQIGSGTCSSGTVTITSSTLADGSHTITARQTDLAGNTSSASAGLSITVDTTGPSVSFTSPLNGSTTAGTISLGATSTDSLTSVVGVLFSYGATIIGSEDTSSPYSVSLDTTTLTDGAYTLNAVARDVVGNYSTSTVSITVTNAVATTPSSGPTQSSGPTAYSSAPTSAIPGIYNPAGNNGTSGVISPTKAIASVIVQSAGITPNFNFTQNATVRTINNEVINIQRMLNTMGYTVATTGVGSKGNESLFFGPKTRLALMRFQRAFAIPATGFFGPLSRAAMNRVLNSIR